MDYVVIVLWPNENLSMSHVHSIALQCLTAHSIPNPFGSLSISERTDNHIIASTNVSRLIQALDSFLNAHNMPASEINAASVAQLKVGCLGTALQSSIRSLYFFALLRRSQKTFVNSWCRVLSPCSLVPVCKIARLWFHLHRGAAYG